MPINRKVNCIHEHHGKCYLKPLKKVLFIQFRQSCPDYFRWPDSFDTDCELAVPIPRPRPSPTPPYASREYTMAVQAMTIQPNPYTMAVQPNPLMPLQSSGAKLVEAIIERENARKKDTEKKKFIFISKEGL